MLMCRGMSDLPSSVGTLIIVCTFDSVDTLMFLFLLLLGAGG